MEPKQGNGIQVEFRLDSACEGCLLAYSEIETTGIALQNICPGRFAVHSNGGETGQRRFQEVYRTFLLKKLTAQACRGATTPLSSASNTTATTVRVTNPFAADYMPPPNKAARVATPQETFAQVVSRPREALAGNVRPHEAVDLPYRGRGRGGRGRGASRGRRVEAGRNQEVPSMTIGSYGDHVNNPRKCIVCDEQVQTSSENSASEFEMLRHSIQAGHIPASTLPTLACNYCSTVFDERREFESHHRAHPDHHAEQNPNIVANYLIRWLNHVASTLKTDLAGLATWLNSTGRNWFTRGGYGAVWYNYKEDMANQNKLLSAIDPGRRSIELGMPQISGPTDHHHNAWQLFKRASELGLSQFECAILGSGRCHMLLARCVRRAQSGLMPRVTQPALQVRCAGEERTVRLPSIGQEAIGQEKCIKCGSGDHISRECPQGSMAARAAARASQVQQVSPIQAAAEVPVPVVAPQPQAAAEMPVPVVAPQPPQAVAQNAVAGPQPLQAEVENVVTGPQPLQAVPQPDSMEGVVLASQDQAVVVVADLVLDIPINDNGDYVNLQPDDESYRDLLDESVEDITNPLL